MLHCWIRLAGSPPLTEYKAAKNEFVPETIPMPISICEMAPVAPEKNSLA